MCPAMKIMTVLLIHLLLWHSMAEKKDTTPRRTKCCDEVGLQSSRKVRRQVRRRVRREFKISMKTRSVVAKERAILCGGVAGILGLPQELLRTIHEYCDITELLHANKFFFFKAKPIIKYWRLTKDCSKRYQKSKSFRLAAKGRVKDTSTQLSLNLSYCSNITDVSALEGVHTLNLSRCRNITDVSALGGVHTLNLSYCGNITDVSALGDVHVIRS